MPVSNYCRWYNLLCRIDILKVTVEVGSKCEAFRREYDEERPHSAIANKTPIELLKTIGQTSRPTV